MSDTSERVGGTVASPVCGEGAGDCPAKSGKCNCDSTPAPTRFRVGDIVRTSVKWCAQPAGSRVRIKCVRGSEEGDSLAPYDYGAEFLTTGDSLAFMEDELAPDWGPEPLADWELDMLANNTPTCDGEAPFEAAVHELYGEAEQLLLSKHADYGPKNIAQAPGGALNGLRVRIWDKVARLNHLTAAEAMPNHEGLRDTLLDLANYALIGCLVLDDDWPSGD